MLVETTKRLCIFEGRFRANEMAAKRKGWRMEDEEKEEMFVRFVQCESADVFDGNPAMGLNTLSTDLASWKHTHARAHRGRERDAERERYTGYESNGDIQIDRIRFNDSLTIGKMANAAMDVGAGS